jgi:hypothetical protein
MTKKFILKFKLETFASSLQATKEEIVNVPDFVEITRDEAEDVDYCRGNLIDYYDAYIASADIPFSMTFRRTATHGQDCGRVLSEWAQEAKEKEERS